MKKTLLAAATAACALMAFQAPAQADIIDFTYTGAPGSGITGSGTITTGQANPPGSFFTPSLEITGITGTFDGNTITALLPDGTFYVTSGLFGSPGNDNILYYPGTQTFNGQPTYLDRYGVAFSTGTDMINLFFGLGGYGVLDSVNGSNTVASNIGGTFTLTPQAVPEPATWLLLLSGLGLAGLFGRRKFRFRALTASAA
ncbi:MAG TPA: PEP-CTERM sorting domain-containing protein [Rhizomicrobium sp.]|nr:PEP-CTERM sorting domain-containing protein [Rhizomicrobium sp.]